MNSSKWQNRPMEILLVEDSPGDIRLTEEAFKVSNIPYRLHVAEDGVEAMKFLKMEGDHNGAPVPDLILLDLNMPRMDGRELLGLIKADKKLKLIPVCVLTTSDSDKDVLESYSLYANSYITKPVDIEKFMEVIKTIESFWLSIARLPTTVNHCA